MSEAMQKRSAPGMIKLGLTIAVLSGCPAWGQSATQVLPPTMTPAQPPQTQLPSIKLGADGEIYIPFSRSYVSPLNRGGDWMAGNLSLTGPSNCNMNAGSFDNGSNAWISQCSGSAFSDHVSIPIYPPQGVSSAEQMVSPTATPVTPYAPELPYAQVNIQTKSVQTGHDEDGVFFSVDNSSNSGTDAVGQNIGFCGFCIGMRTHPGANGAMPGVAWAFNPDFRVENGVGPVFAVVEEKDYDNANPNPGGFTAYEWYDGLNYYPVGNGLIMQSCCNTDANQSVVNVSGQTVTWTASTSPTTNPTGGQFTSDTSYLKVNGTYYRATYVSATQMTISANLGTLTGVPAAWSPHQLATAIRIDGYGEVRDNDLEMTDAAYIGLNFAGLHNIAMTTTGDNATFALTMKQGQNTCWNVFDACWSYTGNNTMAFSQNGQDVVSLIGVSGAKDWLQLNNSGSSPASPSIQAVGSDTNIPITLAPKGTSSVVSNGPFSVSGSISATGAVSAPSYQVAGAAGYSGTKTAGSCSIAVTGGLVTNITGC